ncbi:hypothetical protein [Chitinophaga pinensis]|uniref:Uncharacterized protein n=1 Tax=Chitinophaga pinensis (strain ATCC 43595 / DSM 2588 / LMG 13176 / NBRC 15968 / NCIMB 11800 / UQM 2034) TaxID=485918 RepID=A0A979G6M9_CHIPD|nr:hypothetical protein [Chitinophaga pinensis]ACU61658.1 hypothetical protein Cpin_4201 [Chitinophaga pinensis DSM 2588]
MRNKQLLASVQANIRFVITDYYKGAINDVIYMVIRNTARVIVNIISVDGNVLESGQANNNNNVWSYRTLIPNPDFPSAKLHIKAIDDQGHQEELSVSFF